MVTTTPQLLISYLGPFTLAIFNLLQFLAGARDFLLLMDVKERASNKCSLCSDEGTCDENIHDSRTCSHESEKENRAQVQRGLQNFLPH